MNYDQFRTVDAWRAALGLLPVPLRDTQTQDRYVLLNGTTGNFCLDLVGGVDRYSQRTAAWSCDVGHYITCTSDYVWVTRWENQAAEEKFSRKSVFSKLHDFHRYLEKTEPDRSQSIVAHVLRVFHQIRSVLNTENNGPRSLRVLLHLLASAAAGKDYLITEDLDVWGLTSETVEPAQKIPEATWRPLYNDLAGIGRYEVLRPEFDLLLRHASGAVFQDAHIEAMLPSSFWLPGFEQPVIVDEKAIPSETGIYFTPPALARTLAEEATRVRLSTPDAPIRLFDPACGSGELLKECLRMLRLNQYRGHIYVTGWDKSSAAIDIARFVLAWEKRAWPINQIEVEVAQHDSTMTEHWPTAVDVLIMNPPFKSWDLMTSDEKEAVSRILGPLRKPNLAMAFARRAIDVLREDGILAMIVPGSLLEAASGRDTREALADALSPRLVARLGEQTVFARALVDAGMYIGQRKSKPISRYQEGLPSSAGRETAIVWADSRQQGLNQALRGLRRWRGAEVEPINGDGFSVYLRAGIGTTGDPWIARSYDAWFRYQQFQHNKKLVDSKLFFQVRQGIRLGSDVFVVPKEYVKRLKKRERRYFRPAVMNPSVIDGQLSDSYYAFYPYSDGLPRIETEQQLEETVPRYYKEYLAPAKARLQSRQYVISKENLNWWDLLRPRTWQMERRPKIVSKYFGDSRSFAFDKTGDFVVVVGHAWIIKKGAVEKAITDEEVYLAVLTYLNSGIAYDLLKYLSIQVSGGQLNLSNKYVRDLPVPNLTVLEPRELHDLIQMGSIISKGKVEHWRDVDDLVFSILAS